MESEYVIVTRHAGLVEWLKKYGITGEVIPHITNPEKEILGKVVIGNIPMHLAVMANYIVVVDMPGLKPEQRGKDLTPEEMDAAGAAVTVYTVRDITRDAFAPAGSIQTESSYDLKDDIERTIWDYEDTFRRGEW